MQVRVLFFGVLKDILKRDSEAVELPQHAAVNTLLDHYRSTTSQFDRVWPSLAVAVNEQYVPASHPLSDGDEVALLPPVSGGSPSASTPAPATQVAIVQQRIDPEVWLATLKQGEDGAVVVFDGIVRNNTRGRRTLYLVYEAYDTMALSQMRELCAQAIERFGVRGIVAVHRLGRLEVGETSVFLAVASAHRGAGLRGLPLVDRHAQENGARSGRRSTLRTARYGPTASHSQPNCRRFPHPESRIRDAAPAPLRHGFHPCPGAIHPRCSDHSLPRYRAAHPCGRSPGRMYS